MVQDDATGLGSPLLARRALLLATLAINDLALLALNGGLNHKFAYSTDKITKEGCVNNLPYELWMLLVWTSRLSL